MAESDAEGLYKVPGDYEAFLGAAAEDLPYYMEAMRGCPAVLDLACGSGRLSLPLAQAGHRIVGVDREAAMLAAARRRCAGLAPAPQWLQADIRGFRLERPVDGAVLAYNGLQHLCDAADLDAFFESLRRALKPQGRFALDLHLPQAALLARDPDEWFGLENGPLSPGGERLVAERSAYDPVTQVLAQSWIASRPDGGSRQLGLRLRQFFPQELRALLRAQGFRTLSHEGGFARRSAGALQPEAGAAGAPGLKRAISPRTVDKLSRLPSTGLGSGSSGLLKKPDFGPWRRLLGLQGGFAQALDEFCRPRDEIIAGLADAGQQGSLISMALQGVGAGPIIAVQAPRQQRPGFAEAEIDGGVHVQGVHVPQRAALVPGDVQADLGGADDGQGMDGDGLVAAAANLMGRAQFAPEHGFGQRAADRIRVRQHQDVHGCSTLKRRTRRPMRRLRSCRGANAAVAFSLWILASPIIPTCWRSAPKICSTPRFC